MIHLHISEPNSKQKRFLSAKAKHIGYGGARGGGKSWGIRTKAKLLAVNYAGIKILVVRRTYKELTGNHINILRAETQKIAAYNSTDKILKFVNGSAIEFMYCARDADLDSLQGQEYDVIFLDEATQLSEYQMKAIAACCRGVNAFPKRIYYTCNPGGQGHAYIKRVFIDRQFTSKETPEDYVFIQALVDDNVALMEAQPEYVDFLEALPEKLREAWRHGRWDVFEGQVFGEFVDDPQHYYDRKGSHVTEPFDIPAGWMVYRSFDWGYAKPFSVGWYAINKDGPMFRFRELYGCTGEADRGVEWTVERVAEAIREVEATDPQLRGRKVIGVADPAIWQENGGPSIAETMSRYRIYFDKADHKRIPGKMQCHYRLAMDDDGRSMFYVFKTCRHFIRTIPALVYSETDVEDVDTKMEDHIYDEWRYVCMARPIKPRMRVQKKAVDYRNAGDPLNMLKDMYGSRQGSGYRNVL